jgi:UPF0716 protein FxsA
VRLRWTLLLLLPLADAALLAGIAASGLVGWPAIVLAVVLTGLVGLLLVRAEGRRTLRRLQSTAAAGELPADELLDGGLLIAAGAFLLTPGLVSDAIGLLFVLPPTRIPIRMALRRWVVVPYVDRTTDGLVSGSTYTFGVSTGDPDGGVTFHPGGPGDPKGPDADDGRGTDPLGSDDTHRIEFDDD